MITSGYKLKAEDIAKFRELKKSEAYSFYINSIVNSPAYFTLLRDHISSIDISKDLNDLKSEKIIPESCPNDVLNQVFKNSMSKLVLSICADSIILKELETKNIEDISTDIETDSANIYLLGLAPEFYYNSAKAKIEKGEIDENSFYTKGVLAYNKRHENIKLQKPISKVEKKQVPISKSIKQKSRSIDLSGSNIQI